MYRVAYFLVSGLVAAIGLSGCSLGTANVSTGFASPASTQSVKSSMQRSTGLGASSSLRNRKNSSRSTARSQSAGSNKHLASLGRSANRPAGSRSKRATRYQGVKLDIDRARTLINRYRKSKGLKPLTLDAELTNAAKAHSRDLARWDRISHYGSDGSSPWDRVKRTGFNAKLAAENVGTGQASIDEVFKGWQKSAGHNKNLLLADAQNMGIALVYDPKTEFKTFWTLVIGTRL